MTTLRSWIASATKLTHSYARSWSVATAVLQQPTHKLWNTNITKFQLASLDRALHRYLNHEPLTRIAGMTEFYGYQFLISAYVLDPRPETEMLVEHAVQHAAQSTPTSILDLGTGSGCIICAILATLLARNLHLYALATDISPYALTIASQNARQLNLKCDFLLSDWCTNITQTFDIVVSNPPYISTKAILPQDVWAYDPPAALYAGQSGLDVHRAALPQLPRILNAHAVILWEIGCEQKETVLDCARSVFPDAKNLEVINDFNDLPRMLKIQL